ncbi:hypothetical protein H6H02_12615 [Coleofasciculus sp. FACHB-1120]|nr:hypothetical protein [Coleofasciculus sp. FACHB-1120]
MFKNHSKPVNPSETVHQSERIFAALVLTGILSLGAGLTLLQTAFAAPATLSESITRLVRLKDQKVGQNLDRKQANRLPPRIANTVRQDLSRQTGIAPGKLKITEFSQETWKDGCLGLPKSGEFCTQALVPGWRVVVSNGRKTWVYRTNSTGQVVRLQNSDTPVSSIPKDLPKAVTSAILPIAAEQLEVTPDKIRLVQAEKKTWPDACLGIYAPDILCAPATVDGWQVTVEGSGKRLVYRTNATGSVVKVDQLASLPNSVRDAVLREASGQFKLPTTELSIIQAQQYNWDSCLGLGGINESCLTNAIPGWQVTVQNKLQLLVYHTNSDGSIVKFNQAASKLSDAGILKPTPIPTSELPPSLDKNVVFRAIESGGFTGRTYETVLLNDGSLMRVRIGDANDSERSVLRIPVQQVRQFQQMLERQQFAQFKNLSYPAPSGAADHITYTLSSRKGTVRYTDINQESLPAPLEKVIQDWNRLASSAQR